MLFVDQLAWVAVAAAVAIATSTADCSTPGLSPPATKDRALGVITRQTDHLRRRVDDLLDLSRMTRNELQLRRRTWISAKSSRTAPVMGKAAG